MPTAGALDQLANTTYWQQPLNVNWRGIMKGYWIVLGAEVTDLEAQQEYARLWRPIGEKYGAQLKSLDAEALKEAGGSNRALTVEFESFAQAKACYEDPAYTEAKAFALRASKRQLIIIEGELV
jgi:uncharacterized protein (DUF1330 family)